jgi:hypothetical protein
MLLTRLWGFVFYRGWLLLLLCLLCGLSLLGLQHDRAQKAPHGTVLSPEIPEIDSNSPNRQDDDGTYAGTEKPETELLRTLFDTPHHLHSSCPLGLCFSSWHRTSTPWIRSDGKHRPSQEADNHQQTADLE